MSTKKTNGNTTNNKKLEKSAKPMSKEAQAIIIAVLVIVLVVAIAMTIAGRKAKDKMNQPTQATTVSTTGSMTEATTQDPDATAKFKKGPNGWEVNMTADEEGIVPYSDLHYVTLPDISKKPALYYFDNGHYVADYTGPAYYSGDGSSNWCVIKGKANPNLNAAVQYNGFARLVQNGHFMDDYNGEVQVDYVTMNCKNGCIIGLSNGGVPDGTVFHNHFKMLD